MPGCHSANGVCRIRQAGQHGMSSPYRECNSNTEQRFTLEKVPDEYTTRNVRIEVASPRPSVDQRSLQEDNPDPLCLTLNTNDLFLYVANCSANLAGDQIFLYNPNTHRLEIGHHHNSNGLGYGCVQANGGSYGITLEPCERDFYLEQQWWTFRNDTGEVIQTADGREDCLVYDLERSSPAIANCSDTDSSKFTMISEPTSLQHYLTILLEEDGQDDEILRTDLPEFTGQIRSQLDENLCWQKTDRYVELVLAPCNENDWNQLFTFNSSTNSIHLAQDGESAFLNTKPTGIFGEPRHWGARQWRFKLVLIYC